MTTNVFELRNSVVGEYEQYVKSFVNALDPRISEFVHSRLDGGELWPDPVLQLNPAYVQAECLGELTQHGVIHPDAAKFFGNHIRLYDHQKRALMAAQNGDNYLVTTGTGSGKSLTYLVPIYDAIMKEHPETGGVRAVLVYPMNALINSQRESLDRYADNFPGNVVRYATYTGQTSQEIRNELQTNPPHILLTNYVMLEYLLLRPLDRQMLATATQNLRFIVMDELHQYRGRQGADVAMLLRKLSRHASSEVQYIGTSATMATEGTAEDRKRVAGQVASTLFGAPVGVENVIDEQLKRVALSPVPTRANRQLLTPDDRGYQVQG